MKTSSLPHRFCVSAFAAALLCTWISPLQSATIPPIDAASRALAWMNNHPLMGKVSREIIRTETFPAAGPPGAVYVMSLNPTGYLILNSDDRLPLVLAFSENSPVSLADSPDNALLTLLRKHVATSAETLATTETAPIMKSMAVTALSQDEIVGPLLETSWNQTNPYNLYCPPDPAPANGYDGRVSTGCVPTAFAQVMKFHRWPIHGRGSHQYTDSVGSVQGAHTADFSDSYDWDAMQNSYSSGDVATPPSAFKTSVGELMFELGVAAEADYQSAGTSSSVFDLGNALGAYMYYRQPASHFVSTTVFAALEADLRAGYPSVVSLPSHAIVVDGLLASGGSTSYHISYGWGGTNNGWYSANSIPYGPINGGVTSIVPNLMAFPASESVSLVTGQPSELQWFLPRKREQLAQQVQLYRRVSLTQSWSHNAASFGKAANTGWSIAPVSQRTDGSCWFAGPIGPAILDLDETFVPTASSQLTFWRKARLASNAFRVMISTDNGQTYTDAYNLNNIYEYNFQQQTISLADYAGQRVKLRFELVWGSSYYSDGGIWLDDLTVTNSTWSSWASHGSPLPLSARRFSKTTTLWDGAADFTKFQKTSTSNSWVTTTLDISNQGFYRQSEGYYTTRDHLTSIGTITPTANTRLVLRMKTTLYEDSFHVLVSTNLTTFTEVGTVTGSSDWSNQTFSLASWAGTPIYVRLEYWGGSYYPGGGVWIDSISTEEVTNPQFEQQPLHFCAFTPPTDGGTYEMAAAVIDDNQVEQPISPSFTMTVTAPKLAAHGTPHLWLTTYGGVPAGSADAVFDAAELTDPLGKGTTLMQEYLFGTDPTSTSSRLRLAISRAAGGGFTLQWNGMAGRTYRVLHAASLVGPWTESIALPCQTDQTSMSWTDTTSAQSRRFYRLGVGLSE